MPQALRLTMTDYVNPTHWRWMLADANDSYVADHDVGIRFVPRTRMLGVSDDLNEIMGLDAYAG